MRAACAITLVHPTTIALLAVLLLMACRPAAHGAELLDEARAPSRLLLGYEGGNFFSYPYLTLKVPVWGSLENGWSVKLSGDGLQYEFNVGPKRIHATAPAGEALVGYTISRDMGSLGLLAGPQYRHTSYNPSFSSPHHFNDLGIKSEFSGTGHLSDMVNLGDMVHMTVTASYTTVNEMYRIQGRPLLVGARNGIQVGPEAIYLANPDFRRQQYGLAVSSIPLTRIVSLTVHGGYMRHEAVASGAVTTGAYYGVGLVVPLGGGLPATGTGEEPE